jgi:hypothetical protein
MIKGKGNWCRKASQFYLTISLSSILLLCGCAAKMAVTPEVNQMNHVDFQIKGKILYEGNKEYLPRTITEGAVPGDGISFQYTYEAIYGEHDIPDIVAWVNPLHLAGFPTGENTLIIRGKLDILKGKELIKSYTATCGLEKTRSLFWEGETYSSLRKKGLIAVRDNIEAQMKQDRDFLYKLPIGN